MAADAELATAAAELREALDAAHVTSRLSIDDRGWIDVQLWGVTDDSPAPGLISALHRADDYLVRKRQVRGFSVRPFGEPGCRCPCLEARALRFGATSRALPA